MACKAQTIQIWSYLRAYSLDIKLYVLQVVYVCLMNSNNSKKKISVLHVFLQIYVCLVSETAKAIYACV